MICCKGENPPDEGEFHLDRAPSGRITLCFTRDGCQQILLAYNESTRDFERIGLVCRDFPFDLDSNYRIKIREMVND